MSKSYYCPLFVLVIWLSVGCTRRPTALIHQPIDLRVVGDDALTLRLRDALEQSIARSPKFYLASQQPSAVVIKIPSNVRWRRDGRRLKVLYTVEFTIGGYRHEAAGSCWSDSYAKCSSDIMRSAETFLSEVRHR